MAIDYKRAEEVLQVVRETGSLRQACRELSISRNTFIGWIEQDSSLADAYARAKELGIDNLVEETLDIADTAPKTTPHGIDSADVSDKKVRIETRRWLAERLAPRKYGVQQKLDLTNSDGKLQPVDDTARSARVAQLLAIAAKRKAGQDLTDDDFGDLA